MMLPGGGQHERRVAFAAGHASPDTASEEELLGGELVVKIEDATVWSPCTPICIESPCDYAPHSCMATRVAQKHMTHSTPHQSGLHTLQGLAMAQLEQGSSGSSSESSPAAVTRGGAAGVLLGPGRSFGGNLARHFAGRKRGLYCVLQCEGNTKHTAMVSGIHPAWKQELSFKSVPISSDLQVAPHAAEQSPMADKSTSRLLPAMLFQTCAPSCSAKELKPAFRANLTAIWLQITIYRKGHMGTDHFLGEIVVPLREVEEVEGSLKEADIRRYTLGRRSAKDKVQISLG